MNKIMFVFHWTLDIMILKVYGKIFKIVRYGFDNVLNVCKDRMMT